MADGVKRASMLYISYDGMLEPLGQSQVIAYLERLPADWTITLISFEKKADFFDTAALGVMRARLAAAGIDWIPLHYHKSPTLPATGYDIARGIALAVWVARRRCVQIVHARSYVAALIALAVKRATAARFIFDMRGFWADERADAGFWSRDSRLYKVVKVLERQLLQEADHVVTLTHASAREIATFDYLRARMPAITVIPTCADLDRFKPAGKLLENRFRFGYVGSIGLGQLFEQVLRLFGRHIVPKKPESRLLIVNRGEHARIREMIARAGIFERVELTSSSHCSMPSLVQRMTVASALYAAEYSALARAPTKLAEYLGCGVPCIGNAGVGDMQDILEDNRVGIALTDFSGAAMDSATDRLLALADDPAARQRCVDTAQRLFSLNVGVARYDEIYRELAGFGRRRSSASHSRLYHEI